jgi:hypothetical protein
VTKAAGPGITWYELLGVQPGVSAAEIRGKYESRTKVLGAENLAGASPAVLKAASRAQDILSTALRVLGDPRSREQYDAAVGFRATGGGVVRRENLPSGSGLAWSDWAFLAGSPGEEILGGLTVLADWLGGPGPRKPSRVPVPDICGLFYSVCLGIVGKLDLRLRIERLTEHPAAVDGLVVGQRPQPLTKARRGSELTVQVWHPAARITPPSGRR